MRSIRVLLLAEAVTFAVAALVHFGILVDGYQHPQAGIPETLIALTLLAGMAGTYMRPMRAPTAGLVAQALALLGTLVGIFTIIVGIGPQTIPDIIYHVAIVAVLIFGIVVALRTRSDTSAITAGLPS